MKNLISMTDFVLEQIKKLKSSEINILQFRNSIEKYAHFLKQLLELSQFAPCDENNELIVKRHYQYFDNEFEYDDYLKQYQKATKRCLFKGLGIDAVKHHIKLGRNIEYLANFGTLNVTETTLKQLE